MRTYTDGNLDGKYVAWHENGLKREQANYKAGKLHGQLKVWSKQGSLVADVGYREGKLHGRAIEYSHGQKIKEADYNQGRLVSVSGTEPVVECDFVPRDSAEMYNKKDVHDSDSDGDMLSTKIKGEDPATYEKIEALRARMAKIDSKDAPREPLNPCTFPTPRPNPAPEPKDVGKEKVTEAAGDE